MRYSHNEITIVAGQFNTGLTVTIEILDLDSNTLLLLSDDNCIESAIEGVYIFNTGNIINEFGSVKQLLYKMTDNLSNTFIGKFVYGGYVDEIAKTIDTNTILTSLEQNISSLIETHDTDIKDELTALEDGIRQVLTNISNELNEHQITFEKSNMRITI